MGPPPCGFEKAATMPNFRISGARATRNRFIEKRALRSRSYVIDVGRNGVFFEGNERLFASAHTGDAAISRFEPRAIVLILAGFCWSVYNSVR